MTFSSTSGNASQDYERIAKAIEYIRAHADEQPTLADIAESAGLSSFHLQRLFSRWAGISPKRFLQVLTVRLAKERLRGRSDVLTATFDSGLSSPGRLHDLFISIEAVTPGEFKAKGKGLVIRYGIGVSPFGPCFVGVTDRGICSMQFADSPADRRAVEKRFHEDWAQAERIEDVRAVNRILKQMFGSNGAPRAPVSVLVRGTNFQVQVWRALLSIPSGETTTYRTIAESIGKPTAYRAVATAIGSNRVGFLIPCHRVLREDGGLGGYRWGETRKVALLALEAS